jgi:hypothetical protein
MSRPPPKIDGAKENDRMYSIYVHPDKRSDNKVDIRLAIIGNEEVTKYKAGSLKERPHLVTGDTHLTRPKPKSVSNDVLARELYVVFDNLVRSFDYPVHSSTVDVAYRTIAYKQHSLYADNPIEMVDQPEQTIQVRYRQIQLAESTWKVPKMPEYTGEYMFEIFGETACFRTHKFAKVPLGIGVQAPAGIAVKMPSNIISQMEGWRPEAIREAQLRPIVSFNFASGDLYTCLDAQAEPILDAHGDLPVPPSSDARQAAVGVESDRLQGVA